MYDELFGFLRFCLPILALSALLILGIGLAIPWLEHLTHQYFDWVHSFFQEEVCSTLIELSHFV